jgi:16S rRNA (adenine(1408)-N(1))-methyltransferase
LSLSYPDNPTKQEENMEIIRGKTTSFLNNAALVEQLSACKNVHLDIGTGDGRFVHHLAEACPDDFVIGIDANRDNLREVSRRAPANALFVIANALRLPQELYGTASHITINFPWGSLIDGLLAEEPVLLDGLQATTRPGTSLEVRLNGGALAEAGWSLEDGSRQVRSVLAANGFQMRNATPMTAGDLKAFPTTWAKRLAFGRDPRAVWLRGIRVINVSAASTYEMTVNPSLISELE